MQAHLLNNSITMIATANEKGYQSNQLNESFTFEQFEEECIFECNSHFFYHKYSSKSKMNTVSFSEAFSCRFPNKQNKNSRVHLRQHDKEPNNSEIFRCVAIGYGQNVLSLCLNHCSVTDRMVEAFLPHLHRVQYIQFEGIEIGADSIRAIAKFCGETLKSLRVKGCRSITSESCGWMAGAIGHNSPRLRKLRALDVSSTKVDDRGFSFLSKGFSLLEYIDLGGCTNLTNKCLQKHMNHGSFNFMQVLNMRGCKGINDEGVVAIATMMPALKHLNLSLCGVLTNITASAIGEGCTQLETLSLEGAVEINDVGLGLLAKRTKLSLLNITGCNVTRKSLLAIVFALGFLSIF